MCKLNTAYKYKKLDFIYSNDHSVCNENVFRINAISVFRLYIPQDTNTI